MDTSSSSVLHIVCAVLPIVWLYVSLCVLRLPGYAACPAGLGIAAALAFLVWGRSAAEVGSAALEGALFAVWPIVFIVFAAMTLFRYSELSGGMGTIRALLSGTSSDRRVLALVLAWSFGGFLEGISGFGTPVLIPGAILVSLGFPPLTAVVCCLIANTTPTAFAQIAIPVTTLASVTGLDAAQLGAYVAMQTFLPSLLVPFLIVAVAGGGARAIRGIFSITLISALSFALPMFLLGVFAGPELATLVGSVCSVAGTVAANRRLYKHTDESAKYQLNREQRAPECGAAGGTAGGAANSANTGVLPQERMSVLNACLPFIFVFAIVLLTNLVAPVKALLAQLSTTATIYVGEGAKPLTFSWALAPGVLILAAAFLSCLVQRQRQRQSIALLARAAGVVLRGSGKIALTIVAIIAMAKVMSYGGLTNEIAVWLVAAFGAYYPLIAPAIGTLGTFITGSDTSCCVLFGELQMKAAAAVGADPAWVSASNLSGASVGKMISPQSIAIGLGVGGLDGQEGDILKRMLKYSVPFAMIVCLTTYLA